VAPNDYRVLVAGDGRLVCPDLPSGRYTVASWWAGMGTRGEAALANAPDCDWDSHGANCGVFCTLTSAGDLVRCVCVCSLGHAGAKERSGGGAACAGAAHSPPGGAARAGKRACGRRCGGRRGAQGRRGGSGSGSAGQKKFSVCYPLSHRLTRALRCAAPRRAAAPRQVCEGLPAGEYTVLRANPAAEVRARSGAARAPSR
jgi:hypothetical protein